MLKDIEESVVYIEIVKVEFGGKFITVLGSFRAKEVRFRSVVKFS